MQSNTLNNSRGFTLVEVLVAVVILSIGLLAVAGMQTTSLRGGNNALYRSQAVLGAEDILDRMRANRTVALNGGYDITLADATPVPPFATFALRELAEWRDSLATNVPAGNGEVARNGNVFTITVEWTDSFGTEQVEMVTRL